MYILGGLSTGRTRQVKKPRTAGLVLHEEKKELWLNYSVFN